MQHWAVDGFKIPGKIVFIREKKLRNTNFLASRHIKEEKASLPVDVHRSKSSLLRVSNVKTTVCKTCARSLKFLFQ